MAGRRALEVIAGYDSAHNGRLDPHLLVVQSSDRVHRREADAKHVAADNTDAERRARRCGARPRRLAEEDAGNCGSQFDHRDTYLHGQGDDAW